MTFCKVSSGQQFVSNTSQPNDTGLEGSKQDKVIKAVLFITVFLYTQPNKVAWILRCLGRKKIKVR